MGRFIRPIGYVLVIALAFAPLFVLVNRLSSRVDAAEQRESATYSSFQQAQSAVRKLSEQVKALGGDPVVDPSAISPAPTPSTSSSIASPSLLRRAVDAYCASGACDGKRPTLAQVASALTTYCATGACKGASGKNGKDGVSGSAGPGPTDSQLAAAVASYCASGACKGDPGKDGADGKDGSDGKDGAPGATGPAGPSGSVTAGDYSCPGGEVVTGLHVGSDGSMTLSCSNPIAPQASQ